MHYNSGVSDIICGNAFFVLLLEILVEKFTDLGYSSVGVLPNQKNVILLEQDQLIQEKAEQVRLHLAPFILSLPSKRLWDSFISQ